MAVLAVFLPIGNIYFFFTYCDSNVDFSSNVFFSFFPSSVISSSDFLTVFSDTSLSDTGTPESFTYPPTGKNTCTMRLRNRRGYSGRVKCQTVLINFPYSSSDTDIQFDQHLSTRMEPLVLVYSPIQQSYRHGVGLLNRFSINAAKPAFFCVLLFACSTEMLNKITV